jgi:hypothetical protein
VDAAARARLVTTAPAWWASLSRDDQRRCAEELAREVLALTEEARRVAGEAARWERYACDLAEQVLALVEDAESPARGRALRRLEGRELVGRG